MYDAVRDEWMSCSTCRKFEMGWDRMGWDGAGPEEGGREGCLPGFHIHIHAVRQAGLAWGGGSLGYVKRVARWEPTHSCSSFACSRWRGFGNLESKNERTWMVMFVILRRS